jgi:type III pantothenate kinase
MNLVVDIGNTFAKIAVFDQEELLQFKKFKVLDKANLNDLFHDYPIKKAILSSVKKDNAFAVDFFKNKKIYFLQFNSFTKLPLNNKYNTPATLGSDRLALASGLYFKFPKTNALVIGTGTCITYDFVSENGDYMGGAISPGIEMRYKAINHFTDQLPLLDIVDEEIALIGNTTNDSIISGVQTGVIAEIEGVINRYNDKCKDLMVVLCGGNTNYLYKNVKNLTFAEQNFLLYSLNKILIFNAS